MIGELTIGNVFEIAAIVFSILGSYFIIKTNWKPYGLLFILSAVIGALFCLLFVLMGFYSFPIQLFPLLPIPVFELFTVLPFIVIMGIKYSPVKWAWKIPYYWTFVHIVMSIEVICLYNPLKLIDYKARWDVWDSYTWWWIFFLLCEWIGGKIIPSHSRTPLESKSFHYGRWAWIIFHFIVITTIFLAGFYAGRMFK